MSTPPSLREELWAYNDSLDHCLRCRFRMSVRTFKTIKALVQLSGVLLGGYAMYLGAEPGLMMLMITIVYLGPEGLELYIEHSGPGTGGDFRDERRRE